jgi:BirA family transcriptional regulator, biotin operon repressor / biotin---[acetyl-CoA-carboxylase] ligase
MDKIDINEIQKNLTTEIIGKTLIALETVDSTNTYASGLLNDINKIPQLPDYNGIVVISEIQTGGRGRFDRKWLSPRGGIWMTIILQPALEIKDFSKMNLLSASAIIETLIKNYKISLNVKWPNDIYFNSKKLSGILSESEKFNDKTYLMIGIGINVNNDFGNYKNEILNAVSLKEITGKQINRNLLIAGILNEFEARYIYYSKTLDFKGIFKKIENIMIY